MIYSPLEQFQIPVFIQLILFKFNITITLNVLVLGFIIGFLYLIIYILFMFQSKILFINKSSFYLIDTLIAFISKTLIENLTKSNLKYFPFVFSIFFFILSLNIIGLLPYSFTITSHLIITVFFSLSIFIGINIIGIRKHKMKMFSLFLPSGTSFLLSFLIVPIELMSYIFRPISLSVRLFANMMAGHTLLKVIFGFATQIAILNVFIYFAPFLLIVALLFLEFSVACIQAYVFTILTILYIKDILYITH